MKENDKLSILHNFNNKEDKSEVDTIEYILKYCLLQKFFMSFFLSLLHINLQIDTHTCTK